MSSKTFKLIAAIASTILLAAALALIVIRFRDEIENIISDAKSKLDQKRNIALHHEEFSDYADVEV